LTALENRNSPFCILTRRSLLSKKTGQQQQGFSNNPSIKIPALPHNRAAAPAPIKRSQPKAN